MKIIFSESEKATITKLAAQQILETVVKDAVAARAQELMDENEDITPTEFHKKYVGGSAVEKPEPGLLVPRHLKDVK